MRRFSNEKGLSLAELLAVFVIASIVITLVMSAIIYVHKQYRSQSTDAHHLTDVTIAAKAITKDIRMEEEQITVSDERKIEFESLSTVYEWDEENKILKKDEASYIYNIKTFNVFPNGVKEQGDAIHIFIESTTGQKIETEIIVR